MFIAAVCQADSGDAHAHLTGCAGLASVVALAAVKAIGARVYSIRTALCQAETGDADAKLANLAGRACVRIIVDGTNAVRTVSNCTRLITITTMVGTGTDVHPLSITNHISTVDGSIWERGHNSERLRNLRYTI